MPRALTAKSINEPDVPLQSRLLSSLVLNSKWFTRGHRQMRNIHYKASLLSVFVGFHWAGRSIRTCGLGLNWMRVCLSHVSLLQWGGYECSPTPPFPKLDVSGLSYTLEDTISEQGWRQRLRCQWKQGKDVFMVINKPGYYNWPWHSWMNVPPEATSKLCKVWEIGMLLRVIKES